MFASFSGSFFCCLAKVKTVSLFVVPSIVDCGVRQSSDDSDAFAFGLKTVLQSHYNNATLLLGCFRSFITR